MAIPPTPIPYPAPDLTDDDIDLMTAVRYALNLEYPPSRPDQPLDFVWSAVADVAAPWRNLPNFDLYSLVQSYDVELMSAGRLMLGLDVESDDEAQVERDMERIRLLIISVRRIGRDVTWRAHVTVSTPMIRDHRQFQMIVRNVIHNAIRDYEKGVKP